MNAILLSIFLSPAVLFLDTDIQVDRGDEMTTANYHVSYEIDRPVDQVFEMLVKSTKELFDANSSLIESEIVEDNGESFLARQRFGVELSVFSDYTDMLLSYNITENDSCRRISWELEESLDGKVADSGGSYEVRSENGTTTVLYNSTTVYNSNGRIIAFALRNFSARRLENTLNALMEELD